MHDRFVQNVGAPKPNLFAQMARSSELDAFLSNLIRAFSRLQEPKPSRSFVGELLEQGVERETCIGRLFECVVSAFFS